MTKRFLLYIILLCSVIVFAQEKDTLTYFNKPLDFVLQDIEKRFETSISYDANIVEQKIVSISNSPNNLQALFQEIEEQHQLKFTKISDNSYILKKIHDYTFNLKEVILYENRPFIGRFFFEHLNTTKTINI